MDFAALVRQWKAATGLMYKVVAARAQMPPNKLSAIANGKNANPRWETIQRIAVGFGVTEAQFLAGPANKITATADDDVPPLRIVALGGSATRPAQRLERAGDHDPQAPPSAQELRDAIDELKASVDALNAISARAALADARREAAATRHPAARRRARPRKHR